MQTYVIHASKPSATSEHGISHDPRVDPAAEYRVLEGGANTDEVYNFALFNSLLLTTSYRVH